MRLPRPGTRWVALSTRDWSAICTWVRHYLGPARFRTFAPEDLRGSAVTWTIGDLSPADRFIDNKKMAAGLVFTSVPFRVSIFRKSPSQRC